MERCMAKYKTISYDQMQMIPLSLTDQLVQGTFEHTLHFLIEEKADLSCFDANYHNDETGSTAFPPAVLLKIILYAYSKGIISSRRIEEACRNNIIFKALSGNIVPDHSTIAAFVSGMKDQIKDIFQFVLMVCSQSGLIGGDMFAIDGCKLPSNASKEWSGTFKELKRKKEKFAKMSDFLLEKHKQADKAGKKDESDNLKIRAERIRKKAEKIQDFLKKQKPKVGKRGREIRSNITDNESGKIISSHGMIQGYNGIAVTDSKNQIIVSAEAFGSVYEGEHLETMVKKADENLKKTSGITMKKKTLLADTNYFCEDNLKKMAEQKIKVVIPDQQYRKRDERFANAGEHKPERKNLYKREEDFKYNDKQDYYICPNGKKLKYHGLKQMRNITMKKYYGKKTECRECLLRKKCVHSDKTRYRMLGRPIKKENSNYSNAMRKLIDTPEGRDIYSKRMGIVEPVFSNMTYCKGMGRFMLRGKEKCDIQWMLYCIVHNIGKIQVYGTA